MRIVKDVKITEQGQITLASEIWDALKATWPGIEEARLLTCIFDGHRVILMPIEDYAASGTITPLAAELLVERGGEYDEYRGGLTFVNDESPLGEYLLNLADPRITLEQVRAELASIGGSFAADIIAEREGR